MSKRGSALILSLLIISVVSVAAFSIARILVSEIKIESGLEDASGAHLTAEASLENGLVEYRKNRNYQVSVEFTPNVVVPFRHIDGRMISATPTNVFLGNNLSGDAQSKELVWFNAVSPTARRGETVEREEVIEKDIAALRVTSLGGASGNCGGPAATVRFCWRWADRLRARGMVITLVSRDGREFDRSKLYPSSFTPPEVDAQDIAFPFPIEDAQTLRFSPLGSGLTPSVNGAIGAYAFNTNGRPMDSGVTTIEATGQFGRSQRKFRVELDRKRDALIGEFDFAVFAGEGGL